MYGRSFEDPDGHHWEVMWMDVAAAQSATARLIDHPVRSSRQALLGMVSSISKGKRAYEGKTRVGVFVGGKAKRAHHSQSRCREMVGTAQRAFAHPTPISNN